MSVAVGAGAGAGTAIVVAAVGGAVVVSASFESFGFGGVETGRGAEDGSALERAGGFAVATAGAEITGVSVIVAEGEDEGDGAVVAASTVTVTEGDAGLADTAGPFAPVEGFVRPRLQTTPPTTAMAIAAASRFRERPVLAGVVGSADPTGCATLSSVELICVATIGSRSALGAAAGTTPGVLDEPGVERRLFGRSEIGSSISSETAASSRASANAPMSANRSRGAFASARTKTSSSSRGRGPASVIASGASRSSDAMTSLKQAPVHGRFPVSASNAVTANAN